MLTRRLWPLFVGDGGLRPCWFIESDVGLRPRWLSESGIGLRRVAADPQTALNRKRHPTASGTRPQTALDRKRRSTARDGAA